ncbi:MAG: hypothetical protein ACREBJ_06485 [Nitrosotalea sp.]
MLSDDLNRKLRKLFKTSVTTCICEPCTQGAVSEWKLFIESKPSKTATRKLMRELLDIEQLHNFEAIKILNTLNTLREQKNIQTSTRKMKALGESKETPSKVDYKDT